MVAFRRQVVACKLVSGRCHASSLKIVDRPQPSLTNWTEWVKENGLFCLVNVDKSASVRRPTTFPKFVTVLRSS